MAESQNLAILPELMNLDIPPSLEHLFKHFYKLIKEECYFKYHAPSLIRSLWSQSI